MTVQRLLGGTSRRRQRARSRGNRRLGPILKGSKNNDNSRLDIRTNRRLDRAVARRPFRLRDRPTAGGDQERGDRQGPSLGFAETAIPSQARNRRRQRDSTGYAQSRNVQLAARQSGRGRLS